MRVSVIIPTLGRPAALLDALRSLAACDPPPHEVIVVDQTTPPAALDREALGLSCPLVALRSSPPNAEVARNLGARAARGEVLLYLDDDVLVDAGLIGAHAAAYADPTVGAVSGFYTEPGEAPVDAIPVRRGATAWIHFPHSFTGRVETGLLSTCNGSIRRALLFEAGGFDENFIRTHLDDTDLSARLRAMGARIIDEPRARLVHLKVPSGGKRPARLDDTVLADRYAWQVWVYFYWSNFGVRGLPELGRKLRGCVVRRPNVVRPWRLVRGLAEAGAGAALAVRAMRGGRKLPLRPGEPCAPST